jgi:hypothetical protein
VVERLVRDQEVAGSNPVTPTALQISAAITQLVHCPRGHFSVFGWREGL